MIGKYVTFSHSGETKQGTVLDKVLWPGCGYPITGYLIASQGEVVSCPYYAIHAIVENKNDEIKVRGKDVSIR